MPASEDEPKPGNLWQQFLFVQCLVLVFLLNGCGGSGVSGSADMSLTKLPSCREVRGGRLESGHGCSTVVVAREPVNVVPLRMEAGDQYVIIAPANQVWWDWHRSNTAPCGREGSLIMRLLPDRFRKAPQSQWFSLIAESSGDQTPHDLCIDPLFTPAANGEMVLYANDASWFYWNNHGEIVVEIQRR